MLVVDFKAADHWKSFLFCSTGISSMISTHWRGSICGRAGRGEKGEVRGKETIIPPSEMDKPLLSPSSPSTPLFFCFSEWVLIIGPLWCVWILCLHTLSQTVSGHQTDGGLYAEDTHMVLHKHPQSALLHGTCHTPMPGPSHAPLIHKNVVK